MITNFKDIVRSLITSGVLILLGIIILGDYWVAVKEDRPIDDSRIVLMKMSVTGLIGVLVVILAAANERYKSIRKFFKAY
jgi:hypothetical protein